MGRNLILIFLACAVYRSSLCVSLFSLNMASVQQSLKTLISIANSLEDSLSWSQLCSGLISLSSNAK